MSLPEAQRTFAIVTFGCKVNQYESQAIRELLQRAGYVEVRPSEEPDLCVVNTCVVTQATENECRRTIRRLSQRSGTQTVVTGCLVMGAAGASKKDSVHYLRKEEAGQIASILQSQGKTDHPPPSVFDLSVSRHAGHARAFLKVQDGCSAACSYCIVPRARGRSRSRPMADILAEAERLTRNGYREMVLTGVHIGGYGKDMGGRANLTALLRELLGIKGIGRLRLGSIEMSDVSPELLSLIASDRRICPHFHIPLQSGGDEILRKMNRKYVAREYLKLMESIKSTIVLPALTTDVIVGFPGESEAAFSRTVDFCRTVGFSRIHVFSFSPRPGTPAAEMPGRVPPNVIRRRKGQLQAVAAELADAYRAQMIGREAELLVEYGRDRRTGLLHGHTERYVGVLIDGPGDWVGTIQRVRITESLEGHLRGEREMH